MKGLKWLNQHSRLLALASVLSLLLSFLLCFIQAKNANAISYSVPLNFSESLNSGTYNVYYRHGQGALSTYQGRNFSLDVQINDNDTDPDYITYFCSQNSFDVSKGDLFLINITASTSETSEVIGSISSIFSSQHFTIFDISDRFSSDDFMTRLRTGSWSASPSSGLQYYAVEYAYYPYQVHSYDILLRADSTGNWPICVGRDAGSRFNIFVIPRAHLSGGYKFNLDINQFIYKLHYDTSSEDMNQKDDEDRENIENQQSDSQDSSDDSQEEAESTGTTLLAAFSSFVTAITNASPSNCNLLMNMGNLNLGNVNLCQLSPPPAFQAIASIFMILFCVPLSIATARKVIDLFRSFQT